MASLQSQVVDDLYQSLLRRAADPDAIAVGTAFLDDGGTVAGLRQMILASEEYKSKNPLLDHHLAHIPEVWNQHNISFFTHRGRFRPLSLMIETVNICNNDCLICPYSSQTRRKQAMPLDLFADIVDQYVEIGGGPVGLTPMVGELFLDKLLLDRLQILRKTSAISEVSAISNASMAYLYSDEELTELLSYFDRIAISIYGLDPDEFKLMTRKDGYGRFREQLVRILSIMGPERVTLGARLLRQRPEPEVSEWCNALAQEAGVDKAKVRMSTTTTYANWGFFDTTRALPLDARWEPDRQNTAQCALPLISLQVLSDGTVSFCGCANFDGKSELTLGNAKDRRLRSLLDDERVRQLWNWSKYGVPEFCKGCTFHMPVKALEGLPQAFAEPLATFGG
ncbi:radical SAM/SPASM domain-containing protein [Erythrobacter sp. WG]|uniref:radical SAM/SPASM domain-containing protein n=1 Tax=Erythrobacter sp. WG TaxID=2985510 RepID=UPI00226EC7CA|nr:radical SAM/SPASM domain-containing protein [Erythrobacter sp. WG]MCX9146037.1 radical SAM protein [Erythrobacter sp. WG]